MRNKGVDGYHAAGPLCVCREAAWVGGASAFPFVRFSFGYVKQVVGFVNFLVGRIG